MDRRLAAFLLEEAAVEGTDHAAPDARAHRRPPWHGARGGDAPAALFPERGAGEAGPRLRGADRPAGIGQTGRLTAILREYADHFRLWCYDLTINEAEMVMMLRKYGALFTYISLLCLPAAALLAFHWANVNVYGGALRTGMVDVAGALVVGVIAVHVPSREDGAFAWKRPASKSRLLGRAYALTAAALFVGSLAAAAAYRPGYTPRRGRGHTGRGGGMRTPRRSISSMPRMRKTPSSSGRPFSARRISRARMWRSFSIWTAGAGRSWGSDRLKKGITGEAGIPYFFTRARSRRGRS